MLEQREKQKEKQKTLYKNRREARKAKKNNQENPAVIRSCFQIMTLGVDPVCLDHRQFGRRRSPGLLLIDTQPSLAPRRNLLSSQNSTDIHSVLQ
ncbi:hypothetical protein TNCV_792711 [Trichonephila clavipes]|nr:hypothetical protein TNCV_792711 [Trichonephila clavipes]